MVYQQYPWHAFFHGFLWQSFRTHDLLSQTGEWTSVIISTESLFSFLSSFDTWISNGSLMLSSSVFNSSELGSLALGSSELGSVVVGSVVLGFVELGSVVLGSVVLSSVVLVSVVLGSVVLSFWLQNLSHHLGNTWQYISHNSSWSPIPSSLENLQL